MVFQRHDLCGFLRKRFVCQSWHHLPILDFARATESMTLRINRILCVARYIWYVRLLTLGACTWGTVAKSSILVTAAAFLVQSTGELLTIVGWQCTWLLFNSGADPGSLEWECLGKRVCAKCTKFFGPRPLLMSHTHNWAWQCSLNRKISHSSRRLVEKTVDHCLCSSIHDMISVENGLYN